MRALLLAALVLIAGCAAAPIGDGGVPTPTGPCEVDSQPTPNPSPDVEPVTYPDPPASVSSQAIRAYVTNFEERYLHNHELAQKGNVTYLETYVEDISVARHGAVYVVRLDSYTNGGTLEHEGEGTPIEIHWDGASQPVTYLVTEDRLLRGEGDLSTDELSDVPTVACL